MVELGVAQAENMFLINASETFCGRHVEHVDPLEPILIGMYDGKLLLLDGTHRIAANLKMGRKPHAYILGEKATRSFEIKE